MQVFISWYLACCGFSDPLGIKSHCLHFCCFPQRISHSLSHELKLVFRFFFLIFIIYFCILFWQKSPETWQIRLKYFPRINSWFTFQSEGFLCVVSESHCCWVSTKKKNNIRIFVQFSFVQKLCYWLCGWGHKSLCQRLTPQFLHSGRVSLLDTNKCSKVVLSINSYIHSWQQQRKQKQVKTEFQAALDIIS